MYKIGYFPENNQRCVDAFPVYMDVINKTRKERRVYEFRTILESDTGNSAKSSDY